MYSSNITDLRNRYMPFGTEIDWVLPTVPQTAANGRVYTHAQGKVLGGSSAINGAVYIRPAEEEYATFEKLGATGWSFTTVQKAGMKSEKLTMPATKLGGVQPNQAYHGTSGPVSVTIQNNVSSFFDTVAVPTIENLGHTWNPDNNGGSPNGATPVQVTIFPDSYNRSYSPNTYLEHDIWYLSRAVAYTRNITAAEPLASYIESEVTPGSNITSPDQLESWLKTNFRTMSHFVGTAAAVPKAKGGVVDPRNFKVYGTQNVRVVDASTIPLLPGIHMMSLVYAIA
ncbi:hypothetical protein FRC11_011975, partial [Ceratobasidium sp. 423]